MAVDATYQPKTYHKQSGDVFVIASGGEVQVDSGGKIEAPEAANLNTQGVFPVLHRITIADAASGNTEVTLDHKTRIIDAWVVKVSADGHASEDTIVVGAGGSAISDAMAIGANNVRSITRAATINDANHDIAAAGALRITWVKGSSGGNNVACEVYVMGLRVA